MRVLVTGGAGFIGSHLARELQANGASVFIVDNLSGGFENNIPEGVTFLKLDLAEHNTYSKLPDGIEVVYHLASQVSGEVSVVDPVADFRSNSFATLQLLHWAHNQGVRRFLFASSMGVYQDRLGTPVDESSSVLPRSFYGVSKLTSENHVRIFSDLGMETVIFRLFNVYGPGQNMIDLKQGMVSIYLHFVLNGLSLQVKGGLERYRDFVFISDVVCALMLGLNPKAKSKTFNVCTGVKTTVSELIQEILQSSGNPREYPIERLPSTPRDIYGCWGNGKFIKSELGWEPTILLKEGLIKTISVLRNGN